MKNILDELTREFKDAKSLNKRLETPFREFSKLQAKLKQGEHHLTDEQKMYMNKGQDIIAKAKEDLKENLK